MTAEQAYDLVVGKVTAITADESERRGKFTHDEADPAQSEPLERAFRLDVTAYDPTGPDGVRGCKARHLQGMLRVAYQQPGAMRRALRDANDIIAALRACDGGEVTFSLEGSEFDSETKPGWLFHVRYFDLEHTGT